MTGYTVAIANQQSTLTVETGRIERAITAVLEGESIPDAVINVALVDNATIHQTNRQFLQHDYPTDVITFPWDEPEGPLTGDIMISAEMANQVAADHGWSAEDELLLYAIHGTLHLTGHDDQSDQDRAAMQERETHYLKRLNVDVSHRQSPPVSDGAEKQPVQPTQESA